MKLNIGCGKVIFPLDKDNIPYPEHLKPLDDEMLEPGWINVDKRAGDGVGEVIDLFVYPWIRSTNGSPFNDSSADVIYAGHILEHVPHVALVHKEAPAKMAYHYSTLANRLDGWFIFLYECWRILKPGGLLMIRAPWAWSTAAICDPSHTRALLPGSFSYTAAPNGDAPFDYGIPLHFEMIELPILRFRNAPPDSESMSAEALTHYAMMHIDACDEFRMKLVAIKGDE
jgi:hypothetical protein